jgi:ATP-binding cassette, subfamily B, bacterial
MEELDTLVWPVRRLGEAITGLARFRGWRLRSAEPPVCPTGLEHDGAEALRGWLEAVAAWLGVEAELVEVPHDEVASLVQGAGPALLRLPGREKPGFLALLGCQRRRVLLLGPDLVVHRVPMEVVCRACCHAIEAPLVAEVEHVLDAVGVSRRHRHRARRLMLGERLSGIRLEHCWVLRLPAAASFWQQMRQARLPGYLLGLLGAYATQYLCWILAWGLLGRGALNGRLDPAWLVAWGLLLVTVIPLRLWNTWVQGRLAFGVGGLLKTRLLAGALRLTPEEMRHQGAGQFLGRVLEAEAVEGLALSGGLLGLLTGVEVAMAACVLVTGAGGWLQVGLLLGWLGVAGGLGWHFLGQRRHWTAARLTMTHALVERMVGHRTRLAQEAPSSWHVGEDQELAAYLASSRRLDCTAAWLTALIPRGWLLVGLLGLGPALVAGRDTAVTMAIGVGGTLLAYEACKKFTTALGHLAGAMLAWHQVAPLFAAAARPQVMTPPAYAMPPGEPRDDERGMPLLEAHALVFRHRVRGAPVLQECSLQMCMGDRLLLEGPSGGGKSTLASLLTGLRQPESGLLLLGGLDLPTLGTVGWRRRVVAAPQFHDNYIFAGTLAFNLLMGRRWPPHPADLQAAETLCRALDLGPLLDRMPAGLGQIVGETGWQLSHGERSRLYIARALLQDASVLILDESFAALDPETLHRVQQCVLAHASTLLVIAHP